ncbi:hypothetical protein [uncultured Pontibacter sp.]|uniref:hypothetical protein n=1 Tax=uncultured Pontibacter sp. TaxID=453356 RepID=UPI002638A4CC|nr:hypothetical protein [uncultured Pontibacter sp.]
MIHMRNFIPNLTPLKIEQLKSWSNLRQEQLSEAIFITKDCIVGFLKRQLEKGNWKEVQDVLKGKPMTKAGKFFYNELRGKVVSTLMMRLGLRRIVAVGIALVLVPVILAKVAGEAVRTIKKH